jgi:hypothetical protein
VGQPPILSLYRYTQLFSITLQIAGKAISIKPLVLTEITRYLLKYIAKHDTAAQVAGNITGMLGVQKESNEI